MALYEKAISNLHAKNLILYLAFADFEEQQMKTENAHEIYKKFLAQEGVDPTLVRLDIISISHLVWSRIFSEVLFRIFKKIYILVSFNGFF